MTIVTNLTGNEILEVQGIAQNGQLSGQTETTTTGAIAALAAAGDDTAIKETAITTVGNGTLTAAALVGGQIARSGPVAAYTDTLATAAQIVAALPSFQSGSTFFIRIKNATAYTQTLAAPGGGNITLPATVIISAFSFAQYFATIGGTAASPTVTLTHMGTFAIANNITVPALAFQSLSTTGATGSLTAAMMVTGATARTGPTQAFTDTTDTAANIIAAQPGLVGKIGTAFLYYYSNATAYPATLTGGLGVTVSQVTVVPGGMVGAYLITYTAANTITMVGLGTTNNVSTALALAGSVSGQTTLAASANPVENTVTLPLFTDTLQGGVSAICTATTSATTNTVLANATGLSVNVQTLGNYALYAYLAVSANATAGIKIALGGSANASAANLTGKNYNGSTLNSVTNTTSITGSLGASNSASTLYELEGAVSINSPGTITVQFAQNTSNAGATSVLQNSYIVLTRMTAG